jgi:putative DNA primase/helicase
MAGTLTSLLDAIAASGITPPDMIIADGKIHRFGRKKSSWYVAFLEPVGTIVFGDWRLGFTEKFCDVDRHLARHERKNISDKIKQSARRYQKELESTQSRAATACIQFWREARPVTSHPYIIRKRVEPYRLRSMKECLLVPVTDGTRIHSIQRIDPNGEKRFYPGGKVRGHFYPIGFDEEHSEIFICEGIATGLTIYQLQQAPVIVAFYASNLVPVSELIRWRYPEAAIVIAGDNDHATPGNPGKAAAELAAIQSFSNWTVPDFDGLPATDKHTDFNDWAILRGLL